MPYLVHDILDLAKRAAVLDFQALLRDRSTNGFQHFILDLVKEPDSAGNGWKFSKGLLTVQDPHDTSEIMNFLESKLQHHPWFQTRAKREELLRNGVIIEQPELPVGYESYTQVFKSLGYWGKNPAMDVSTTIENEDGSLSEQVIIRPFDKKFAFVGGMIDKDAHKQKAEIIKKCQQEFLEEFYSKDLFAKGSATLRDGAAIDKSTLVNGLTTILADKEFSKLFAFKDLLLGIFSQVGIGFNTKITELERQLKALSVQHGIRSEDADVFWVRIKCRLYQELFPTQYQQLCQFLESNLVQMPETTNESDPRNTQAAFMTTTPHYFFLSRAELRNMQRSWLVEAKGGDDAESTKIVRLEALFDKPMYSAHGRIKLEMLAHKARLEPEYFNHPVRQAQLAAIEQKIAQREITELHLVPGVDGVILQQQRPGTASQLATITGQPALTQLNSVAQVGDTPMNLVDSTQTANQILLTSLGGPRYARMEQELERNAIPASARVSLADICQSGKFNIILDNSTSMNSEYRNSEGVVSTRWNEAHERFKKILPLLALAGVKVELRFLNKPNGFDHKPYLFDFSKNVGGNEVASLEHELHTATQFIARVFAQDPNGNTIVNKQLTDIFSANNTCLKQMTMFITDGDATDLDEALSTLNSRNAALNRLMVVACTNESGDIGWVRQIARKPGSGVAMLDDFKTEQNRFANSHGPLVPYSLRTWLVLHLTPPALSAHDAKGLQVYHLAEAKNGPLTIDELAEILGYEPRATEYRAYLGSIANANVATALPIATTVGFMPGYAAAQAVQQAQYGGATADVVMADVPPQAGLRGAGFQFGR